MKKKDLALYAKNYGVSFADFHLILEKHLDRTKTEIFLLEEIDAIYIHAIKTDIKKRYSGFPIEYIIQQANFFSLDFFIDQRVLIPRNDTEIMVEAVQKIENLADFYLIDLGVGSGAVAISIIKNTPLSQAIGIDISPEALQVARINRKKYNLSREIILMQNNLLENFNNIQKMGNISNNTPLIITANLPYIKDNDLHNMSPETYRFEPHLALFGGDTTGFELYEKLISQIIEIQNKGLFPKIILFIEIGFDQKDYCATYLKKRGLSFSIFSDRHSIERCIKIYFDF